MRRLAVAVTGALVCAASACECGGAAGDGTAPYVTNGAVYAIAIGADGTRYLGGGFTFIGPATGGGVRIDGVSGERLTPSPLVDGEVLAAVPDGAGGWFIGGVFEKVGGVPRHNLAHVLAGGRVDPAWAPSTTVTRQPWSYGSPEVLALALSGGTLYVGGSFDHVSGQPRHQLAAIDAATGVVTAWAPGTESLGPGVYALAVGASSVFVGGDFYQAGGQPRHGLAAIDKATGAVTSWKPEPNGAVHALALEGSTLYAGGTFTRIGGQPRNKLAALDVETGAPTAWDPDAGDSTGSTVDALLVSGSTVYVGGRFTQIGGEARENLAAVDTTSGAAAAWNPSATGPADSSVRALAMSGTTIYVGGSFSSVGGLPRANLAAIDASTGALTTWDPGTGAAVAALAVSWREVFAGGRFRAAGGVTRNGIAALDPATGRPTPWNPDANGVVWALTASGDTVYVGGSFTAIGGQPRENVAALDAATGLATAWNPGADGGVSAFAVTPTTVYIGGWFRNLGGRSRPFLAAVSSETGTATDWNPGAGMNPVCCGVSSLALSGSTLYAAGSFEFMGGQPRNGLAALDTATGVATPWDPRPNGEVHALAVSGDTLYVGGHFTSIGGEPRLRLAALDTAGAATPWNPNQDPSARFHTIAAPGDDVYVGGWFSSIGGVERTGAAALDPVTGAATSWDPRVSVDGAAVYALAVTERTVCLGGSFTSVGGQLARYYAEVSR